MFQEAKPFLLALVIGMLIGLERERASADKPVHTPLGSRTFTLIALLGAMAAHLENPVVAAITAVFVAGILISGYFRSELGPRAAGVGTTTQVAAMAVFLLGYLTRWDALLAVMLGVIILLVLALKPRIHWLARAGLSEQEVSAAIAFLVIAFVVLPLLPDRFVDPWRLINPARLWLVFVVLTGIGFAGYISMRWLGPLAGLPLAGLLGGFVSSTATTVALAQRHRDVPGFTGSVATGIVLANSSSAAAQLVVAGIIYGEMLEELGQVIGTAVLAGVLATWLKIWLTGQEGESGPVKLESPVALRQTALLAGVIALMLVGTSLASRLFGAQGVLLVSVLGGASNVHAITVAVASLASAHSISIPDGVLAIFCAFISNMIVKLVLTGWIGGRRLLLLVLPPLLFMILAGVFSYLFLPAWSTAGF